MIRSRVYGLRVPVALLSLASILVLLSVVPASASPNGLVISELRFRGPSGANDEFVELKNTSTNPVDISGYRLQGCAATGGGASDRVAVPTGTTLQPGQYYLFTNSASGGYSDAAPGDRTYTTGFSDTAGSQSGARIVDASGVPIDGVGLPASPCREGTGLNFPTTSGENTAFEREPVGVNDQDTDDNAADFEGPKAGNPQNSGGIAPPPTPACSDGTDNDGDGKIDFSGANPDPGCSSADDNNETDPPVTRISAVQGPGASTPISGQTVTIEGVVTGVDDEIGASFGSGNTIRKFLDDAGIFVQEETADEDSDPNSSEGVFVGFVRDRGAYQPGDVVRINGRVTEKFGQTQINETIDQEPTKTGTAPVPEPVAINEARAEGQNAETRPYYESLEGMRVGLVTGTANSGGTNKFGELFLTPGPEQDRVFRDESVPGLIADAQREFATADFAFMNPGGIRANIEAGPVTYGELFAVQPFDNQVVSMDLTGEQIYRLLEQQFPPNQASKRILQVSGLKYTYNESLSPGNRIISLTKTDGTAIERADTYKVAVNSFIAAGGDSFTVLKEGQNVQTIGSDLDALEDYIDDEATFDAPDPATEQRITKQG